MMNVEAILTYPDEMSLHPGLKFSIHFYTLLFGQCPKLFGTFIKIINRRLVSKRPAFDNETINKAGKVPHGMN
jgi:hypothetical protein